MIPDSRYAAVVLAGERPGPSPVADAAGVCCKALAPVADRPMLLRVLDSLRDSEMVAGVAVVGLRSDARDQLAAGLSDSGEQLPVWLEGGDSPSQSAGYALRAMSADYPLLVTTADHALLNAGMIDDFCARAANSPADLLFAVARIDPGDEAFAAVQPTVSRFSDGGYSGCNLFACNNPNAEKVIAYWQQLEQYRKRPWKLVSRLGWGSILLYLFRRLSLEQAVQRLSAKVGASIEPVVLDYPLAAIDVDSVADWKFANNYLRSSNSPSSVI